MTNEELIQKLRSGAENRQQLLLQLYKQNERLIHKFVKPYRGQGGNDIEDLMQTAFLGLCEAVERYDETKGKFITYCSYWIKAAVREALREQEDLPERLRTKAHALTQLTAEYQMHTGQEPPDAWIRARLKVTQDQLEKLREILPQTRTLSLSEVIQGTDGLTLSEVIPDSQDHIAELCDGLDSLTEARELWGAVDSLEPLQAQVIKLRCIDQQSNSDTAGQLGLTAYQANAAFTKGCKKLRRQKRVQQIGRDHGYHSYDLYGGGLSRFRRTWESCVEAAVLNKMVYPWET